MPNFLKSEEKLINVGDVVIKEKTPSRTYIQMWNKLGKYKRINMSRCVYLQLKECSELLDEHPELVEQVVRSRVELISWVRQKGFKERIPGPSIIMCELMTISKWKTEQDISMLYWDNECCPSKGGN